MVKHIDTASFRDPSGYVYFENNEPYRVVNASYFEHYNFLKSSGLLQLLIEKKLLIPHVEITQTETEVLIKPDQIPFISYPYEWTFSQLKAAAMLTLQISIIALEHGMVLKDASAFNVQFNNGKPIFIDTLSFEIYKQNEPWIAYMQFCKHFFAPITLLANNIQTTAAMQLAKIDGIELSDAIEILPFKCRFNLGNYLHLYAHFKSIKINNSTLKSTTRTQVSLKNQMQMLKHLQDCIKSKNLQINKTEWSNYYDEEVDRVGYEVEKKKIVDEWLQSLTPNKTWDMGCNAGEYSILAAKYSKLVISTDFDKQALERLLHLTKSKKIQNILPLFFDVANPTPSIGVNNNERLSLLNRIDVDVCLALAIIHHVTITYQVPMYKFLKLIAKSTKYAIVEWIDENDDKVVRINSNPAVNSWRYNHVEFLKSVQKYFIIKQETKVKNGNRILYLLEKINE
jgi:ribosomal protein L11 methylase PrmA